MDNTSPSQLASTKLKLLELQPDSSDQVLMSATLDHLVQLSLDATVPTTDQHGEPLSADSHPKRNSTPPTQPLPLPRNSNGYERLEKENAKLPRKDSEAYLFDRLQRHHALFKVNHTLGWTETVSQQTDMGSLHDLVVKSGRISVEEEEFWQCVVEDFRLVATKLPHLLSDKLRYGGIPHVLRGVVWRAITQSFAIRLETLYEQLVREDSSPYNRAIQRDLSRTFPNIDIFKQEHGEGQQAMGRLLRAFSIYDAHVGYCQGLAFLVGPLLATMSEKHAFCVFVRLMETYEMRTMFTLHMEGLHLRLHQFETVFVQLCPKLAAHLATHSIHPAMYASQWYLTLFAYAFPFDLVLRIYDLAFVDGAVETITRVAVAVMRKNEQALLALDDFEQLVIYLSSSRLYEEGYQSDPDKVIEDAMSLGDIITKEGLDRMGETYQTDREQQVTGAHPMLENQLTIKSQRESWFGRPSSTPRRSTSSVSEVIDRMPSVPNALWPNHYRQDKNSENPSRRPSSVVDTADTRSSPRALDDDDDDGDDFVESLKKSGEFGAAIAGALTAEKSSATDAALEVRHPCIDPVRQVTSELVSFKLANFEMGQKYERLCHVHEGVKNELAHARQREGHLQDQLARMETELETVCQLRDQLEEAYLASQATQRDLEEKLTVSRKTASELQLEKLQLANDVEQLEAQVRQLEREKQEYLMPRSSFSEEVFAAHQTLFGPKEEEEEEEEAAPLLPQQRTRPQQQPDYQQKYIDSELRCRELEKLLAEAKFKLVEYETTLPGLSRSMHNKRNSSPSLTILANTGRLSSPTSPSFSDSRRESTDSMFSSTLSKRSSVYSRLWNPFGSSSTAATSPTTSVAHKSPVLEPTLVSDEILELI